MSRTRKYHLYYLLLAAMAVTATFAVRGCQRTVPLEECSELYQRYADSPHLEVAFIRDFPVNDTLSLDVTTLTALDSTGWDTLMYCFGFPQELIDDYRIKRKKGVGNSKIHFFIEKNNPSKRPMPGTGINPYVVANVDKQVFCVYHVESSAQYYAAICYETSMMKNTINSNKKQHEN
ncbi:MAG: hypothetical protein ACSW8I_08430 [bacterium]